MGQKAIFFDIDGTLWDFRNRIPESTRLAMEQLRQNGHLCFINGGRARGFINHPDLLSLGFDGIVSGCGTMIEYRDRTIFRHLIEPALAVRTVDIIRKYHVRPILEGPRYLYMDMEDFGRDPYGRKLIREMGDALKPLTALRGRWEICKLACDGTGGDLPGCCRELEKDFSMIFHNDVIVEMVPAGFSKGTGILEVCDLLGIDPDDTYAFGDGQNDMEMIRTAGHGIAMGSGTDGLKKAADYITAPLFEDGVYKACAHFGLL